MVQVLQVDGWWPQFRYPYVLTGASFATVIDVRTSTILAVETDRVNGVDQPCWPAGWINDSQYVITREVGKDVRQACVRTVGRREEAKVWGPSFRCGGPVKTFAGKLVFAGHAAYTPDVAGLWWGNPDGTNWTRMPVSPLPAGAHGMSNRVQNNRLAVHCVDPDVWWILDAVGNRIATLPTDHLCIPGPELVHGMGYWGPALLRAEVGGPWDVTVTSWRKEGPPVPFLYRGQTWVATATGNDAGFNSIIVRPLVDHTRVLQIDGFEAVSVDVQVVGDALFAAGNDTRGVLYLATFDLTAERRSFVEPITSPPPPPPPPTIDPWPPADATLPPGKGWKLRPDITEIDMLSYAFGDVPWSRNGMHVPSTTVTYSHPFQSRIVREANADRGYVVHEKFSDPDRRFAVFTFTGKWIGLAFDGTNELAKGYRFVNVGTTDTAPIYPRFMKVGRRYTVKLDILTLATNTRRTVTFAGWVSAIYENTVAFGSFPAGTLHAAVWFEPAAGESTGWRELSFCAQHEGPWYWHQEKKTPGAQPDMRWVGSKNATRQKNLTPVYADKYPVEVVVPPPPPPIQEPVMPKETTLRAHTGLLCAELDKSVIANRTDVGPWETWTVEKVASSPLQIALKSHHGFYLCAELGGGQEVVANREGVGPWETFTVEPVRPGVVALKAHNGQYVCAEADGRINANRDAIGAWEEWETNLAAASSPGPIGPGDPVGTPPAGSLRRRGRVVFDDKGERLILSASMFHATTLLEHAPDIYADNLAVSQEASIDEWRIGAVIEWPEDVQDERPNEPRHVEKIVETIDRQWNAGIRTDLCLFLAQVTVPELQTLSACEDYTRRVCRALKDRTDRIRITVANEPGDSGRIWAFGLSGLRRIRDIVRQELPGVLVSLGAPFHPTAHATTDWTAESREDGENAMPWFAEGCDIVSPHYSRAENERRNARQPWLGRRDADDYNVVVCDEEPIGPWNYYDRAGNLRGLNTQDPNIVGMHRTAAWCAGNAITTFHSGAGIGYQRLVGPLPYSRLRDMPGVFHCAAAKAILPGNLPAYRTGNWHWSVPQGQLFDRFYEPSDSAGTAATRGHCSVRLDDFVNHEFFAERSYELRARVAMTFSVWERQETRFVKTAEHSLNAGERFTLSPCLDRVLIGKYR